MIRLCISLILLALASCSRPSTAVSVAAARCHTNSLQQVFENPLAYDGKRFCGYATAVRHGLTIMVFPFGAVPNDRRQTMAFLEDRRSDDRVRMRISEEGETVDIYLEAGVDVMRECFELECAPFRRPIFLHSSRLDFAGPS